MQVVTPLYPRRLCPLLPQVFDEVSALVGSVLDGYNVCIMAYGQTGRCGAPAPARSPAGPLGQGCCAEAACTTGCHRRLSSTLAIPE